MSDIAVVIVTWNCAAYLRGCLSSLVRDAERRPRRVIVVDNASTDGGPDLISEEFPEVHLVEPGQNLGFAAANNIALRACQEEYVLLLNPDTEVEAGAVDAMAAFLDSHDAVWGVGPTILNGDGSLQRSGVRSPTPWNLLVETLFLDRLFPRTRIFGAHRELYRDPATARRVEYVQGSCLMVRRQQVVERAGLLDEGFFMYFEETDWCRRIGDQGGEIWICPEARGVQFGGGEEGHFDEARVLHYHRSLFRYMALHGSALSRLLTRLVIAVRIPLRLLVWLLAAAVRPSLRAKGASAMRGYLRTLPLLFTEPLVLPCASR